MAYKTRVRKIYGAFTEADYKRIHRLAKKSGVSATHWVYESVMNRVERELSVARIARASRKAGKK